MICYTKHQWKRIIKEKIKEKNRRDLLEQIKGYKKLSFNKLSKEPFEKKKYFDELTLEQSRIKFRLKSM